MSQRLGEHITVNSEGYKNCLSEKSTRSTQLTTTSAVSYVLEDDVQRVSNTVQAQIEKMFTDVVKDVTSCSFVVRCLGSLPLKEKVSSLLGLQEPLRQLYLSGAGHGVSIITSV